MARVPQRSLLMSVLFCVAFAGCIGEGEPPEPPADADQDDTKAEEPFVIEWEGHVVTGYLDPLAHREDPEGLIFSMQQAGFLVELTEAPTAIEVMVTWEGDDASFRLHPHYKAKHDPAPGGETVYYGYLSDFYTGGAGCVRVPEADMAAGVWPMMVHPTRDTMDQDFRITVAIWGAEGVVLDDMHGHRTLGPSPVEDHGIEPCTHLMQGEPTDAEAGDSA